MKPEATAPQHKELGRYQLGLLLGEGGMGEVYKAYDDRLGRWVAVKRVRGDAAALARIRFQREARILAQLGHPAIVQIFDLIENEAGHWIVMELIDGPTLSELRRGGPLDVGLTLDYSQQITSALKAAHGRGIVHRDLKTENVMVLPSGYVKVLDFGLAHHVESASTEKTVIKELESSKDFFSRPGRVVGTPRSMSPEQARGVQVDMRSDLFSFGVLLYEVLTARSPFTGRTVKEVLWRIMTHQPPPVRQIMPKVPKELSELVNCLLEKDPAHRPQSAAMVEVELAAIATGDPVFFVASSGLSQVETLDGERADDGVSPHATLHVGASQGGDALVRTILASELVGSTRLAERLGAYEAATLFRQHDRLVQDLLVRFNGQEIDKDDGFVLLLFARPWRAVSYALAYHKELSGLDLTARVGIHLGEVILYRNALEDIERGAKLLEVEGLAKPATVRLMSLSIGGQTLLTRSTYEVARRSVASEGSLGLEWLNHGSYRFQGIGDEVEVFEVGVPGTAPFVVPVGLGKVRRIGSTWPAVEKPSGAPVVLRSWPLSESPKQPYPVLLPYTHPELLAGRDQEIACLRRLLLSPVPVLGLSALSGIGKSSLVLGGLVPTLRAEGVPVAMVQHPAEAGLASRLISDLLDGSVLVADGDAVGFCGRLTEVELLSGMAAVLVLDQFEDLLAEGKEAARSLLGTLMSMSVMRRPGFTAPPCRWLLVYRQEFHGRVRIWLKNVLGEAQAMGVPGVEALPHDLSQPERFHCMTLSPLATPSTGSSDPLFEAMGVFLAAIKKPIAGSPSLFPWYFPPGHAERLALAFAFARLKQPRAPLVPELQVVLAHLLAASGREKCVRVPEDASSLIERALDDHLHKALEVAFPKGTAASPTRRARALLALRELATSAGQRDEGLCTEKLVQAIGENGRVILEKLSTPLTRLVVVREADDGLRWVLAHDQMAEVVVRLVDSEGRQGKVVLDTELLALRRFVILRTALYQTQEFELSTRVSRQFFRRIDNHAEALLWDEESWAWFEACRTRRRNDGRRLRGLITLAVLVLALIGWGTWTRARWLATYRSLSEQVVRGEPDVAFQALIKLKALPDADFAKLQALLRKRSIPMDILELGLDAFDKPKQSIAVLQVVELVLPWVAESPENSILVANLIWALDFVPGRDPPFAARAKALRDRVLEPLRQLRPPPPFPAAEDPDWVYIPAGRFLMGTGPGEEGKEHERPQHQVDVQALRMLRHEVTNAEYRRLVPTHPGEADLPVAFVNWYAAYTYAAWLGGRLPTEAEWEYSARAGCLYAFCTREGLETTLDTVAWTVRNSLNKTIGELTPRPVMQLEPNPWGLYDMLGNLWEWTADWYGEYPVSPQSDPWSRHVRGGGRVDRGGGFRIEVDGSRVAFRDWIAPGKEFEFLGFRVALQTHAER